MFLFDTNSRIRKTTEGIRFYERDVLLSEYGFTGNIKIEVKLDYIAPGFGIVLIEDTSSGLKGAHNAYLYKLGTADFRVIKKHYKTQQQLHVSSNTFDPGQNQKNIRLVFELKNGTMTVSLRRERTDGFELTELGKYKASNMFKNYHIGFYSNKDNVIKEVNFFENVPDHWRVSTKNTIGGRISLEKDTVRIENCEKEAEIEQLEIPLKKGTYYVSHSLEPVNGKNDISCFVFHSYVSDDNEKNLEDEEKNILEKDMSFTLQEDSYVNLKYKGHEGIVKNIAIMDNPHSTFIETKDEQYTQSGSEIKIKLKNLSKINWTAVITDLPPWNLAEECPYAVVEGNGIRHYIEELGIRLNASIDYEYDVNAKELSVFDEERKVKKTYEIPASDVLYIMKNLTAVISSLVLTETSGNKVDVLEHKTFKRYVPAEIESPIIVTDPETGESFDLSAAYREIVEEHTVISVFSKENPVQLVNAAPKNSRRFTVYGIPKGAIIKTSETEISKLASKYAVINESKFQRKGSYVQIDDSVWNYYEFVAVEYSAVDRVVYEFTNYEREIYPGTEEYLVLEKVPSSRNEDITVYGVPKSSQIIEKNLYKAPSESMINSIDFYTDDYEIIPASMMNIDLETCEISLNDTLQGRYQQYVVDYLKKDSYAINFRPEHQQYEVDISAESNCVEMHYDAHNDGSIAEYKSTEIIPDSSKYIVMRENGGSDIEN